MPVPGSEPEPGPVAPPALSLPPLRDLDKDLTGSETEDYHHHSHHLHRQPRTQSSDPHLHQHFHRTESHRHYKALPQLPSSSFPPIYQHDRQSQYSSSAGSLPDMYANPPSASSSTTTSTLSRADSVSAVDYLQTNRPHGNTRDPANTNATHKNTMNHAYTSSHESETLFQSIDDSKPSPPIGRNTKGSKNVISAKTEVPRAKAGSEGRNSTKRAAQNRAAQRAFRQRKDLYVRELERKAELLPVAESQVASLTARVEQLEALLAAAGADGGVSSTFSSSLASPQSDSPTGLVGAKSQPRDRDWEWESEGRDKPSPQEGVMPDTFNRASSIRRIIPRHSSSHQLRQAYNSPPSPAPTNGSLKHSPHSYHHGGSDQELDTSSAHRHLRRNPSESSLNLRMREQSLSTSPRDAPSNYRSTAFDSRMEITSPPPSDSQSGYGSTRSSTLPVPSGRDHSSTRPYPSSPLTPSHERSPLYSIPQSHATSARPGLSNSPNSTYHSRHFEEGAPSSFTSPDLSKKRPSEGVTNWGGQDLYRSVEVGTESHSYHQVKKQSSWTSLSDQYQNQSSIRKQQSLGSLSDRRLLHQQHSPAIRDIQYYRDNSRSATNGNMTSGGTPLGSALSPISGTFNFSPKIHHSGSGSITLPPVSALSLASPSAGPRVLIDDDVAELSPIHAGERSFHNPYHHRPMLHHRASTNSLRATRNNQRRPSWPELSAGSPGSPGPSGSEGGNWTKMKESPEMLSSEGRFSSPALPALARVQLSYSQKPPLPSPMTYGSVSSSGGATSEHEQGSPYPYPNPHAERRPDRAQANGDTEMMHDAASPLPTSPHRPHQRQGENAMDLSDDPINTRDESGTPMGSP
ncbi:hypothetical protein BG003_008577 [Podila horticola]|nr:hypothetical protein BG003_008577 [Podila horticola]